MKRHATISEIHNTSYLFDSHEWQVTHKGAPRKIVAIGRSDRADRYIVRLKERAAGQSQENVALAADATAFGRERHAGG